MMGMTPHPSVDIGLAGGAMMHRFLLIFFAFGD
jgi:hypothetical protein